MPESFLTHKSGRYNECLLFENDEIYMKYDLIFLDKSWLKFFRDSGEVCNFLKVVDLIVRLAQVNWYSYLPVGR